MSVASILNRKGADVVTIAAGATLGEAARLLDEQRIGAVIIAGEGGQPAGVLSERDIARAVARMGADAAQARVADCMTRNVVTCAPGDSCDMLMALMTDRRIRHVPVMDGGTLAGVVSIGDVVKAKIAEAEAEANSLKSYIATG